MASSEQNELPTLVESNALMVFLQSELLELEALSGSEEQEARSLLQQLEQQTTLLQALSQGHHNQQLPVQTELELAEQLDRWDTAQMLYMRSCGHAIVVRGRPQADYVFCIHILLIRSPP